MSRSEAGRCTPPAPPLATVPTPAPPSPPTTRRQWPQAPLAAPGLLLQSRSRGVEESRRRKRERALKSALPIASGCSSPSVKPPYALGAIQLAQYANARRATSPRLLDSSTRHSLLHCPCQ